jgi:hypothetical protein
MPSGSKQGITIMASMGYLTPEEFAKQAPDHPFARPAIHFGVRPSSTSKNSSAPTKPASPAPDESQRERSER